MIIGCYTLDLYCDGDPECKYSMTNSPGCRNMSAQFTAETGSECRRLAREEGWILNLQEQTTVCPSCAKKGLKPGLAPDPSDHIERD